MGKYSKASDQQIKVLNKDGQEVLMTQRAFDVIYKEKGYTLPQVQGTGDSGKEDGDGENTVEDYATYSRSSLEKVKNDDLKAYLDGKGIKYEANAEKKDLINLIIGE